MISVVVKATVFPEWSEQNLSWLRTKLMPDTQSLPEWFAYVPSKMDYSDLFSIMSL